MTGSKLGFAAIIGAGLLFAVGAGADSTASDLDAAIEALETAAENETNLSPEFKAAVNQLADALRAHDDRSVAAVSMAPEGEARKTFWDRLHPYADMRIRFEQRFDQPGRRDRNRMRSRFRIGAEYDINEEWVAGFRVRTGNPDDENSPHQTWNGTFDSWEFNLDRAYLRYEPEMFDGVSLVGGKASNGFVTNPVYGELVWDGDINPEGFRGAYTWSNGDDASLGLVVAQYWVIERSNAEEAMLFDIQVHGDIKLLDDLVARASVGFWRYTNLDYHGDSSLMGGSDLRGNDITPDDCKTNCKFDSRFEIIDPIVSMTYSGLAWPITLSAEYIHNFRAAGGSRDDGWAVGASTQGKVFDHSYKLFYQYQRIEREAVLATFAQDDFLHGSGYRGHVFGSEVGVAQGIKLKLWSLFSKPFQGNPISSGTQTEKQIRIDLNAKF